MMGSNAPASIRENRARHRVVAVASVVIAVALNLAAIALYASTVAQWHRDARAIQTPGVAWVTAVATDASPAPAQEEPKPTPRAQPAAQPAFASASAPSHEVAASRPQAAPRPSVDTGSTRFYRIDEVQTPAAPAVDADPDWNLDAAALDGAGLSQLAFDILISSTGEVLACKVIIPRDLDPQAKTRLENRVCSTKLQPALRDGMPVASERRIEFSVLPSVTN